MNQPSSAYTTIIPASKTDERIVADLLLSLQAGTAQADSGAAILAAQPTETEHIEFSTNPFNQQGGIGTWVTTTASDTTGVILYLHGRRFQFDEPVDVFAPRLCVATGLSVLKVDYRLAPKFPFPAALEDVLTAYEELLKSTVPPSRIVFVGHSAGATLALSAAIEAACAGRPLPAAVVALSAITDFTYCGQSMKLNSGKDVITRDEALQVRSSYLGDAAPSESPQSPLWGRLGGLPPILLACGGNEIFLDDSVRFAASARAAGVDCSLDIFESMPHAFSVMHLDASALVLNRVAEFARSRLT